MDAGTDADGGGLVDDAAMLPQLPCNTAAALAVFRVIHLNPSHQKLIKSAVSQLRSDHVVVRAYTVKEADQDLGQINVTSNIEDTIAPVNVVSMLDLHSIGPGPGKYQITDEGFPHVVHFRLCHKFEPVLLPRPGLSLKDRSHWEPICILENNGWTLVPSPGRTPILKLDSIEDSDKKCYFASQALDLPIAYMECPLSIDQLLLRGAK